MLSNQLQVSSVHASLWDGEAVFWTRHVTTSVQRTRTKLKALMRGRSSKDPAERSKDGGAGVAAGLLVALPMSVVTTVEASDWSVQLRVDSPSLQSSKRPVVRGVMAACVGNIQWTPLEKDHASSLRYVLTESYRNVPSDAACHVMYLFN